MKRSVISTLTVFTAAVPFILMVAPASAAVAAKPYDFDGNGYPDLAVGAPSLRINTVRNAGGVVVLPSFRTGLSLSEKIVSQSSHGVPGASEEYDFFGYAVTSADFNRDGYADLAVGQPGEGTGTLFKAGAVTVIYGSNTGLDTRRSVGIGQPGGPVDAVNWGISLVAGDFNSDGYPDLAVGAPKDGAEQPEEGIGDGTVRILPGGAAGLRTTGVRILRAQGGPADISAWFGAALAAGDVDGDGDTDLVVGSRGEGTQEEVFGGSISYCAAQTGGPSSCRRLAQSDDYAGLTSLAVGNMSGDALPEIAVGVPDIEEADSGPGSVIIVQLNAGTPVTVAREFKIRQSSAGVPGSDETADCFGYSVALGRVDQDGYADLVAGAPGEDAGRGRVTVVHGAASGWRTSGNAIYGQNTPGIPGGSEEGDSFGSSVALLDHNRDGRLDLTVGASGENRGAGAITTLRGSAAGFTTNGSRTFGLATLDYRYPSGAGFGESLGR